MKTKLLLLYLLTIVGLSSCATSSKNNTCGNNEKFSQIAISHLQNKHGWALSEVADTQVRDQEGCQTVKVVVIHIDDVQPLTEQLDEDTQTTIKQGGGKSLSVVIDVTTQNVINVLEFK